MLQQLILFVAFSQTRLFMNSIVAIREESVLFNSLIKERKLDAHLHSLIDVQGQSFDWVNPNKKYKGFLNTLNP